MKKNPPKWADQLLRWFCHPDYLEGIQGDLYELYYDRVNRAGRRYANLRFNWEVLRAMRYSLLRNPFMNRELQWSNVVRIQSKHSWNEMLFETRNKDYGAYELREAYGGNMLFGFSVVATLSIVLVVWWWLRFMQ